jgi:hypothetical protein
MAFTLSLSRVGTEVPVSPNFSGGEMKRPTFFAEDETFIRTLLSYAYQRPDISEDELFSNRSLTKNHIDHSLIEVLRDLSDFDLFWKHGSDTLPIEKLSNRTLLIDVHHHAGFERAGGLPGRCKRFSAAAARRPRSCRRKSPGWNPGRL